MRYLVLACDYDGTLAHHGKVDRDTMSALEKLLATGRKLVLVTGRELDELMENFPDLHLFARVVAENGALLYRPDTQVEKILAPAPPAEFLELLALNKVEPISVGRAIVATWRPHENAVLSAIRELGLEMQVIFNKEAVMVLPSGVNKATGLIAALHDLGLSPHETVAVGDAENDHAFLSMCECAVAVDNALPALKQHADWVTRGDHGSGVRELIDELVAGDLASLDDRLTRHHLLLGYEENWKEARLPPYGNNVLIAGPSGSGKSTAATSLLERLAEKEYQFCIIDPEGDYENLPGTVALGANRRGPTTDEVVQMLTTSRENVVINLVGIPITDRPSFFLGLLPRLQELRVRTGRPHWLIVDEAHHLLPASWEPGPLVLPRDLKRTVFITVHPEQIAPPALKSIDVVMAVGGSPEDTFAQFCTTLKEAPPKLDPKVLANGEVWLWFRGQEAQARRVRLVPCKAERQRHIRKYAEGELPPDRSFYFRGPKGKLNLRAQNLFLFLQLAEGVDDKTWLFHLQQGDYSQWFRERIKDPHLAEEAVRIEKSKNISAAESREKIREVVQRLYTLPAGAPLPMPGTDAAPKKG